MTAPAPPYYAVIFTSRRTDADEAEYEATAQQMLELAAQQPGFLGVDSARSSDGLGITVSYWRDLDSIRAWRDVPDHRQAQEQGRRLWYADYRIRICRVEAEYGAPHRARPARPGGGEV